MRRISTRSYATRLPPPGIAPSSSRRPRTSPSPAPAGPPSPPPPPPTNTPSDGFAGPSLDLSNSPPPNDASYSRSRASPSRAPDGGLLSSRLEDGLSSLASTSCSDGQSRPSHALTDIPSFLASFLPPSMLASSSSSEESFNLFNLPWQPPVSLPLPPPARIADVQTLSSLQGLLPLATWRQHPTLVKLYLSVPSSLLTVHLHHEVALSLARGPGGLDAFRRLDSVVRRLKADNVEIPPKAAERLLRLATTKASVRTMSLAGLDVTVERMRERSTVDEARFRETWDLLYKEHLEESEEGLESERSSEVDRSNVPPPMARLPAAVPTRKAFDTLLRLPHTPQTFSHLLSLSPVSSAHHLPSILSHLNRSYSTVPAVLPDLLSDPEAILSTRAINEILFAFTADANIRLTVPFEAYVAFRRHAAGLPWRRTYIDRAAKGLYHNFDDALVSFANPILDSMNYSFPPSSAPNRMTYQLLLRAAIHRGDLTLALSVFKDMLNPNSMSLRMPGSAPGREGRPPIELRTFKPTVQDYTQFFVGFRKWGEVQGVSEEAREYWRAHPMAFQLAGGGETGDVFEELSNREQLQKTWNVGMGVEAEEMEDPYTPGFGGEIPHQKQYAVNVATENKKWTLQTFIILFRSFLALKPVPQNDRPIPIQPSYLPPQPPTPYRRDVEAPSARRILYLLYAVDGLSAHDPGIVGSAYKAVEDKFGKGNDEGWVGWKIDGQLERFLGERGIRPRDWAKGYRDGYEETD